MSATVDKPRPADPERLADLHDDLEQREAEAERQALLERERERIAELPGDWVLTRSPNAGDARWVARREWENWNRRTLEFETVVQYESTDITFGRLLRRILRRRDYERTRPRHTRHPSERSTTS